MSGGDQIRRVLLVDDDMSFTAVLKEFLVSRGEGMWEVFTAENYTGALACLKKHSIGLAVLDFHMPVMDGLQFLTLLKRTHPNLPVVILTAYATKENRAYALKNGAALFLDKMAVSDGFESIYAAIEALATTAPPVEGFRGMLRQVGLPDVLQMECLGRKSSTLEITAGNIGGRIYISDGSIVHAEAGTQQGEPALFQLLGLKGGEFHLRPFVQPSRQTIDGNWESLLMEAARLHDEAEGEAVARREADTAKKALEQVAAPETDVTQAQPEQPPTLESDWRIQEILLCSGESEILYEWKTPGIDRRLRLLNQLTSQAEWLGQALPLGRADRLEVNSMGERFVAVLQPDRKVLVRSAVTSEGAI